MANLHMGLLTDRELVELVDQGLASLHARAHDTEGELTTLAHEIDLTCDRWDDVANAVKGFREPA